MRNNKKKGFTLVELLVVIAILAILATVSVVTYTSYIESTQVRVDSDLATQLNHLLEAYKVNFREDITEDNIHEVTTNLLKEGGVTELNPKSSKYGYHYYYNLATGKYELLHNDVAVDDPSVLDKLVRFTLTVFGEEPDNTPNYKKTAGNCFTRDYQYFLVDTAGSDIATVVGGFYSFGLTEEATLEETAAKFADFYEAVSALEYDKFITMLEETVFATANGNFVVDVNGTHKNLIVHSEATYITHIKQDFAGNVQDFRAEGKPMLTVSEPTTVTVPAGVGVIEGSLYIDGEATVVLAGNSWNMIDKDFTNKSVKLGNSTYTLDASDRSKVLDASGNVVATLKANFLATAFDLALVLEENKVVNKANEAEGYVALDNLGFTVQLTNFRNEESGKKYVGASRADVDWDIAYVTMDQNADQVEAFDTFLSKDANSDDFAQKFTINTVNDRLPALDTVVVTATMGGEPKEFIVDVVRVTGIEATLGNTNILTNNTVNLLCNSSNGVTEPTNFNFVSEVSYNHGLDEEALAVLGIELDAGVSFAYTSSDHVHTSACCPHEHDESCSTGCNHIHGTNCVLQCSHTQHNTECCGHTTHTTACYESSDCPHAAGGSAHFGADRTCYTGCSHLNEDSTHTYTCSKHWIDVVTLKIAEHDNECCMHLMSTDEYPNGVHDSECGGDAANCKYRHAMGTEKNPNGVHTSECGGQDDPSKCKYAGSTHTHDKTNSSSKGTRNCCMYYNYKKTGLTFDKTTCVHVQDYYHKPANAYEPCGTCTHTPEEHVENCAGTLICEHVVEGHECDECTHGTAENPCDDECKTCVFTCTGREDCIGCNHDCATEGCLTDEKCKYSKQSAVINGTQGVTGNGNASGTLTINVGNDGTYYSILSVELNFYGAFDVDSNDNITHLGSVALDTTEHTNVVKVEDLFGDNIPTDAVIAIFGEIINPDEDDIINPNRVLLANAEKADKYKDTEYALDFWVEDNIIEYKDGAWEEIKFYGEGSVYIAVISEHETDENNNLKGVRISKDVVAEVVIAKNVRDYADFDTTGASNVILNDITMPHNGYIKFTGGTIYGNHHTFDIQNGVIINRTGIIELVNTNMRDLRVIGSMYPVVSIYNGIDYSTNAVSAKGTVTIENCYIANTRAPLASGYEEDEIADNITVRNTVLYGGRYANIDVRAGILTFDGKVITINQPHTKEKDVASVDLNKRVVGLGVVVWFEAPEDTVSEDGEKIIGTDIQGVENLVQYNFVSESYDNLPVINIKLTISKTPTPTEADPNPEKVTISIDEQVPVNDLFNKIFTDDPNDTTYADYYFITNGERYVNASIISEDLGEKFADVGAMVGLDIPTGDRTGFAGDTVANTLYGNVTYTSTILSAYPVYMHMYGLRNGNDANEAQFTNSVNAEFIYSPWVHTVDGETYVAYDFGSDNDIIIN